MALTHQGTLHVANRRKPLSVTEDQQKVKAATCQLFADVVYWANVLASLRRKSVARTVDPVLRKFLREEIEAAGLDPDEIWKKAQEEAEGKRD
jgi:hypothetical protein